MYLLHYLVSILQHRAANLWSQVELKEHFWDLTCFMIFACPNSNTIFNELKVQKLAKLT